MNWEGVAAFFSAVVDQELINKRNTEYELARTDAKQTMEYVRLIKARDHSTLKIEFARMLRDAILAGVITDGL